MAEELTVPNCPTKQTHERVMATVRCSGIPGYEICLLCEELGIPEGRWAPISEYVNYLYASRMSSEATIQEWQARKREIISQGGVRVVGTSR